MNEPDSVSDLFLARLSSNYLLRMVATLTALFEGEVMLGIVFLAIAQSATSHLQLDRELNAFGGDGVVPDALRRPVTVLSIANSLDIPRETARRYVVRLIERGFCVQVQGRRVIVPGAVYRRPEVLRAIEANRRDLQAVITAARRVDLLRDGPAEPA